MIISSYQPVNRDRNSDQVIKEIILLISILCRQTICSLSGNADNFPYPLEDKYPLDPKTGYPYSKDCAKHAWGDYYFTEAAAAAFQNFYNNTDGLLDAWADFWGKTAQGFNDYRSVIGYELINEPFAGDFYRFVLQ